MVARYCTFLNFLENQGGRQIVCLVIQTTRDFLFGEVKFAEHWAYMLDVGRCGLGSSARTRPDD